MEFTLGLTAKPGGSKANKTGSWRTGSKPHFIQKTCTDCKMCAICCPEGIVYRAGGKNTYWADLDYCKGCGICEQVCPVDDIEMIEEEY